MEARPGGRPPIDVHQLIDDTPVGRFQTLIVLLCGLTAVLDGFDLQSIGLAAPSIAGYLQVAPKEFGAVFSAALLGLMLGAFALGPVADRIGRKPVLIFATSLFGLFTILTAFVTSFQELLLVRLLAGLGLGGAMPSFISLTSEYAPKRWRAMLVTVLWAGFPLGGALGGLLASHLIPAFGWRSVFYVGGVLPLALTALLWLMLPESIGFLITRRPGDGRAHVILRRILPEADPSAILVWREERLEGVPVKHLFAPGRGIGTLLLWVPFFTAFLMLVTNTAWTPTLLRGAGIEVAQSGIAMAAFNFGSVVGTLLVGWLITRLGPYRVLTAAFLTSALAVAAIGWDVSSIVAIIIAEALSGVFLGAGSSGLIALAAIFYPTTIRSTGVGWAMGIGRFGSFVGPLIAGLLVASAWTLPSLYLALAAPALAAALFVLLLGLHERGRPHATPVQVPPALPG